MVWRRRLQEPSTHAVIGFWTWWVEEGESAATTAVGTGDHGDLTSVISAMVRAIHPELAWELAAGSRSKHALIVTAGGTAELRPLAERWRRAAPPASPTWEYHPARQADPNALRHRLNLGGADLVLDEIRVGLALDERRNRVDVGLFHPAFGGMSGSGPGQVTFLVLDWLLGEDDVERWVGGVQPLTSVPEPAHGAVELLRVVDGLRQHDRSEEWALLEGRTDTGERLIASARPFLRWIDRPVLDLHHELTLAFEPARGDGLPEPSALEALRIVERDLERTVAGHGELVVVETSAGRRTWHLYTDTEDQNITDRVTGFASAHGTAYTASADPGWRAVRQFQ